MADAMEGDVKVGQHQRVRPQLLASSASYKPTAVTSVADKRAGARSGFLRTHRRAFVIGTVSAAAIILLGLQLFAYPIGFGKEATAVRKLIAVATKTVSSAAHPLIPPAPVVIQLNTDMVQVTGIALGHPRLAIINGKQLGEGDTLTVHTPARSVTVTLRVLKIADGTVELSDGTQVITAHLRVPPSSE